MKKEDIFLPFQVGQSFHIFDLDGPKLITIAGFRDDDLEKPYAEDTLPGGWINPRRLPRKMVPVRHMTILEMILNNPPNLFLSDYPNFISRNKGIYINGENFVMEDVGEIKVNGSGKEMIGYSKGGDLGMFFLHNLLPADTPRIDNTNYELIVDPSREFMQPNILTQKERDDLNVKIKEQLKKVILGDPLLNHKLWKLLMEEHMNVSNEVSLSPTDLYLTSTTVNINHFLLIDKRTNEVKKKMSTDYIPASYTKRQVKKPVSPLFKQD